MRKEWVGLALVFGLSWMVAGLQNALAGSGAHGRVAFPNFAEVLDLSVQ